MHRFVRLASAMGAVALLCAWMVPVRADDISGAGATFPYPVYAKWAEAYKQQTGIGLNYQSIGSGGGIKQIEASTVTFGASDMPLSPPICSRTDWCSGRMIIGGAVPVVNIPGVKPGDASAGRCHHRVHLPGRHHTLERPGHQKAQSVAEPAEAGHRTGVPLGRFGHQFPVHQLPVEGEPELRQKHRRQYLGAVAGRHRRQGQRGRRQSDHADQRRDRLRRIRLRQADAT